MQHTITDDTVAFIAHWEGFKSHAYYDATGHVWMIGYGHTWGVNKDMACTRTSQCCLQPCQKIRAFLATLGLRLNEKKFYLQHYKKGVAFTGAIIKPGRSYVINRTIENFRKAVIRLDYATTEEAVIHAICFINSYLGLLRQRREYNNRKKILCMINKDVFKEHVYIKGGYEILRLKKRHTERYKTMQKIKNEDREPCVRIDRIAA